MNKKIIGLVSVAWIVAIFFISAVELIIGRLLPYGQSHNLAVQTVDVVASLLALPVRLYASFTYHGHGAWSVPVLILLLAMSCLMWGVIVERVGWLCSTRKTAP